MFNCQPILYYAMLNGFDVLVYNVPRMTLLAALTSTEIVEKIIGFIRNSTGST